MRLAPRPFVALAVLAAVASGCGSFGNRYSNFRAYYNTFYNAERALEQGESGLEEAAVTIDRSRLVPVFPVSQTAGGTSGPFQEAIDKSAELLRSRPDSKWADDALLVIGKAYFYQRNLVGAEQKFQETMAAATLAGDRRLGDQARFWLGRTYALGNRFEDGVATLEEGLAREGGDRRWMGRMQLALGELYARAGRWDEAAEALGAGAPVEGDADVAARAYVLLGQVEAQAERYDAAAEAYREALRRRPAYELAFAAELDRALVLGLDAGDTAAALAIVRAMRADDKHFQRRAEVALAEARLRAASGERGPALALFRDVLYEEGLAGGAVRGQAHYRLGQFYRDVLGDYVRASAHFDTAATALRAPSADVRPAHDAILDVGDEARVYAGLARSARRLAEVDSLLALGDLSEDDFRARIDEIETERRRVFLLEQRELERLRQAQAFSGAGGALGGGLGERSAAVNGRAAAASPAAAAGTGATGEAGFLSYRDPASLQAGQIAFEQRWGDRPLVENWRFRSAIQAGAGGSDRGVVGTTLVGGQGLQGGPPPLDLSAIPRTPAKRDAMVTELAGLRYELANAFFLSLGRADTAAALYRQVLADTPDLPIATRARYALAEIERAAGRDAEARPLYEAVAADSSDLGRASRLRLGLETAAEPSEPGPVATAAYERARRQWQTGEPVAAAEALIADADADPDAPDAPRAYLAAAVALIEAADADSAALAQPLLGRLVSRVLSEVARPAPSAGPPADAPALPARPADRADFDDERLGASERPDAPARQPLQPPALAVPEPVAAPERPVPADMPEAEVQPDSVQPALTQTVPPADSAAASLLNPAEPSAPADSAVFTLRDHLLALAVRYPQAPSAARARTLAEMLPAPVMPEAAPEPAGEGLQPDAPDAPVLAGDPAPSGQETGAPLDLSGLRGGGDVLPEEGGFSWRVRTVTLASEAGPLVGVLRDAEFSVAVLRSPEGALEVLMGQFATAEAAEAVRGSLPAWAQLRGEVVPLAGYAYPDDPDGGLEIDP